MPLTPTFVSYDRRDNYFVGLLRALLDNANVAHWYDQAQIAPGELYERRIADGVRSSRSLIVVVSRHATESEWVPRELSMFCDGREDPTVVPVTLDATAPGDVAPGLGAFQAIDMRRDMLHGFRELFSTFGAEFLCERGERRSGVERRQNPDRRTDSLQRLRTGLWKSYLRARDSRKFDPVDPAVRSPRSRLALSLEEEIRRYHLHDHLHQQVDSVWALRQALAKLAPSDGQRPWTALQAMNQVAFDIWETYDVKYRDRRHPFERRVQSPDSVIPSSIPVTRVRVRKTAESGEPEPTPGHADTDTDRSANES